MLKAKRELLALKEEYEGRLKEQREAIEALRERNRTLEADLSEYRAKEKAIADSCIAASQQREELARQEAQRRSAAEKNNALLAAKCRALLEELLAKYPEAGDVREFEAFVSELEATLSGDSAWDEAALSSEEILKPEKDLEALCRDLGLME